MLDRLVDRRLAAHRGEDLRGAKRVDVEVADDLGLLGNGRGLERRGERAAACEAAGGGEEHDECGSAHGGSFCRWYSRRADPVTSRSLLPGNYPTLLGIAHTPSIARARYQRSRDRP